MNQVSQRDGDDPSPIRIESPVPSDRETATPPGGEREPASDTDGVISSEVVPTPGEHQTLREPDTRGPSHTADPWDGFLQAVHEEIERHRAYPWRARLSNLEGVAWVVFSLGRDGRTTRVDLYRSSGHGILDRAAVDTIRRIPMFPPIPDGIAAPEVELAVPLLFRIDEAE
jgi:protein TonB